MTDLSPRQWGKGDAEPSPLVQLRDQRGDRLIHDQGKWVYVECDGGPVEIYDSGAPWADLDDDYDVAWPLTEVLPEKAKAKPGDRVIATQFGKAHLTVEGILEVPGNPVDEPACVCRDDGIRIYIGEIVEVLPSTDGKITAPWDERTVAALNAFQERGDFHPFTCPREHFTDGEMTLVATSEGWVCSAAPACGYTQDWAHSFMTDVPPAQVFQNAPESGSPVGGQGSGETPATDELGADSWSLADPETELVKTIREWLPGDAAVELADALLNEGWRPPQTSLRAKELEVDGEAGAWYVRILDEDVHHTTEGAPVNIDWTRDGTMIGVEILGSTDKEPEWEWGCGPVDEFPGVRNRPRSEP